MDVHKLDDLLERFLETIVSTIGAVKIDRVASRVIQFQLYLETAIVPITTVAMGLGYNEASTYLKYGTPKEILSNMIRKVEHMQAHITDNATLHKFATTKMQSVQKKFFMYQHMADLFSHNFYDW